MELELNRTALPYHDLIFHTQVTREETMEMIVPDAYPDISKLLDTSGICCLNTREVSEGTLSLAGRIRCRILYLPEDGGEISSLGADLDFQCSVDQEGLTAECSVMAIPRILSAETKAINPRKMLIRVTYEVAVRVYRLETLMVPCGVQESGIVEEKQEQAEGYFAIAVPEKRFQFQDQLNLSGSQPAMAEILRVHADVTCGDAKLIGGKLVFKGEVSLWTLYRSVDHDHSGDRICPALFPDHGRTGGRGDGGISAGSCALGLDAGRTVWRWPESGGRSGSVRLRGDPDPEKSASACGRL